MPSYRSRREYRTAAVDETMLVGAAADEMHAVVAACAAAAAFVVGNEPAALENLNQAAADAQTAGGMMEHVETLGNVEGQLGNPVDDQTVGDADASVDVIDVAADKTNVFSNYASCTYKQSKLKV